MIAIRLRQAHLRLALAACTVAGCGSDESPRTPPGVPLTVMTFNIRYGTAADGADSWARRRNLLFDVIRQEAPDVMGLQEALRSQLDEIHRSVLGYEEVGVGREDGDTTGEYAAILYRADRFTLDTADTFWFSDTPSAPGSTNWGNVIPRICTWARLVDTASGRAIYVYNVHWDHESQPSREQSAALLLERIRDRGAADAVIVTGDFNAGEENAAFQLLTAAESPRLVDTFRAVNPDAAGVIGTYHGFLGRTTGEKIDAILVSPDWRVLDAAIVRTSRDGRYPSDHFPVTARIQLGAQ